MIQTLLFPDPRPLVERLGPDFFRSVPERPGVYLMRDAVDTVLYVGKAKNLRQRLRHYRVANPDRMPRRHLRLLRAVARVEPQECPDEEAALAREAELLRSLKPKFNRAGTWAGPPRFLLWRQAGESIEMKVAGAAEGDWNAHGPLGAGAPVLRRVLVRLIRFAVNPATGISGMPAGWARGHFGEQVAVGCGDRCETVAAELGKFLSGETAPFLQRVKAAIGGELHPFDRSAMEADLEFISPNPETAISTLDGPGGD